MIPSLARLSDNLIAERAAKYGWRFGGVRRTKATTAYFFHRGPIGNIDARRITASKLEFWMRGGCK